MSEDENSLYEKPLEFFSSIAHTGGSCHGQAIVPEGGRYRCYCSCGNWTFETDDREKGLREARLHTGSLTG